MADDLKYKVRVMRKEDVPEVLDLWRQTGYQKGTFRIYTWLQIDPDGFWIAVSDSGEVIGVCCGVIHHDDLAFFGLYTVKKEYRGRGVGMKLWNACLEHVGDRNAALAAAPGKIEMYRGRGGFPVLEEGFRLVGSITMEATYPEKLSDKVPAGGNVQQFQDCHLPSMLEYDLKLVGYRRDLMIELNCKEQDSRSVVAFRHGSCVGFGTIKMSCQGNGLVGPLYADDPAVAEVMLKRLMLSMPQAKGFAVFTISTNGPASQLVKKVGCPIKAEFPMMYRKKTLKVDVMKVYALYDTCFSPF